MSNLDLIDGIDPNSVPIKILDKFLKESKNWIPTCDVNDGAAQYRISRDWLRKLADHLFQAGLNTRDSGIIQKLKRPWPEPRNNHRLDDLKRSKNKCPSHFQ